MSVRSKPNREGECAEPERNKNEMPEGWASVALRELTAPTRPRRDPQEYSALRYVGMEQIESHTRRLLGTSDASEMKSTAFHFQPNDVLYGRLRPYLNKVWRADIEGLCSSEFIVLPPTGAFEPTYLACFLSTDEFVEFANHLNQGDRPRVSFDQIGDFRILIPPLAEQRRIVGKLELLLGKVSSSQQRLSRVPGLLKRFRQSVLAAACSGKLTADWREENSKVESAEVAVERFAASATVQRTRRGVPETVPVTEVVAAWEIPETWTIRSAAYLLRVGALIDLKDGNHGANHPKVSDFTDTGLPFITAAQVNGFAIDYEGAYKISGEPLSRLRVGFAKPGDVIYTHKGSVGRVAIADRDCILTPQTTYYRVAEQLFDKKFVMYFLASPSLVEQVAGVKEQTTRDFVPISEQYLLFHRIPPLAEQQEIVRRVEKLFAFADQIEARLRQAQAHVDRLTQSLLAKAFRGELVPTEHALATREGRDYESADELLVRIRATQASASPAKPKRGKTSKT